MIGTYWKFLVCGEDLLVWDSLHLGLLYFKIMKNIVFISVYRVTRGCDPQNKTKPTPIAGIHQFRDRVGQSPAVPGPLCSGKGLLVLFLSVSYTCVSPLPSVVLPFWKPFSYKVYLFCCRSVLASIIFISNLASSWIFIFVSTVESHL